MLKNPGFFFWGRGRGGVGGWGGGGGEIKYIC